MADDPLPPHEQRRLADAASRTGRPLEELIARRVAGEPLQYIEGTAAFGPIEVVVDRRVLIPRPETEQLWELARGLVEDPSEVVDLCTGSGVIAIAVARSFPRTRVYATELSGEAAAVARENATLLGADVEVLVGDLFEPLSPELRGRVDLIVANPPYVAEGEWTDLPVEVRHEPRIALVAGPAGTEVLDRIAAEAPEWLRRGGWLACEIGETQGAHCRSVLAGSLADVEVRTDLAGRDRFVIGRRP